MKKKQVLVGLGAVAIVAGLSNQVKADETTKADLKQPETTKTAVQRNKAVYGAKGLVLPQTGDQTRETLAMASLLAITALGFVKLKRKEN